MTTMIKNFLIKGKIYLIAVFCLLLLGMGVEWVVTGSTPLSSPPAKMLSPTAQYTHFTPVKVPFVITVTTCTKAVQALNTLVSDNPGGEYTLNETYSKLYQKEYLTFIASCNQTQVAQEAAKTLLPWIHRSTE
jgi:hypothetical protein